MNAPMYVKVMDPVRQEVYTAQLHLKSGQYFLEPADEDHPTEVILSPGWMDLHVHVYDGVTPLSISADLIGLNTGVHLVADAGSAGEATLAGFRRYVVPTYRTEVRAWLNISSIGLVHLREASDINLFDVEKTINAVLDNQPFICGVKVRSERNIVGSLGLQPLQLARTVARAVGKPLMVHIGEPPPNVEDILELLDPGDVVTHCFHGKVGNPWTADGEPIPALMKALQRGVKIDVGHGAGSFSFEIAKKAISSGSTPFSISTDAHAMNINGPVYDLPTTMTKMLTCGMNLMDVISAVTSAPAEVLGLQNWCNLSGPLQRATLFRISEQPPVGRAYMDTKGREITPNEVIVPEAVISDGALIRIDRVTTTLTHNPTDLG
ncbi:amidohydrolase/deacetylase family metallohydrolase [Alicyclobacillus tolerans]|uniref:amidohydrolase/deacetylase family metallohydrolase n=1 Tax=Alicyclobacillus tolerans TaxID=90970 RepID=UPI001F3A9145|nr:amidohydrolase/deacetylase family metallohydrolase [Alicyclobacillus tolerans]MCF8565723.1 amidohydrolase/deacetylase family metallohydrolase [Alicyclobacillus tolerans]